MPSYDFPQKSLMCLEGGFGGSTSLVVTNCAHDLYVSREDIS